MHLCFYNMKDLRTKILYILKTKTTKYIIKVYYIIFNKIMVIFKDSVQLIHSGFSSIDYLCWAYKRTAVGNVHCPPLAASCLKAILYDRPIASSPALRFITLLLTYHLCLLILVWRFWIIFYFKFSPLVKELLNIWEIHLTNWQTMPSHYNIKSPMLNLLIFYGYDNKLWFWNLSIYINYNNFYSPSLFFYKQTRTSFYFSLLV